MFQWLFSASIMQGVAFTIILTVLAMAVGTVLAITMAIMRQSVNPVLRWVAMAYIWFFRGTPIYTQLIFWSLLPTLYPSLSVGVPFLGTLWGWEVSFNRRPTSRRSGWRSWAWASTKARTSRRSCARAC